MSKFQSIVKCKCPRCHKGDLFEVQNPYNIGKFSKMNKTCSNCGLTYEMEQGFWYGAMYVSYALGIAMGVPVMVALGYLTELEVHERLVVIFLVLLAFVPLLFRYSRSIFIHFFVRKDEKFS